MKKLVIGIALTLALSGCAGGGSDAFDIPAGNDVTVQKKDGVRVEGRLVEVSAEHVVVESKDGVKMSVPRGQVASVKALTAIGERPDAAAPAGAAAKDAKDAAARAAAGATTGEAPAAPAAPARPEAPAPPQRDDRTEPSARTPEFREVTVPAGAVLRVALTTPVASDTSNVEDAVRGTLQRAVTAEGVQALPAGTVVTGHVTAAQRSGKVKGRASVGVRFNTIDLPGEGGRESIGTDTITRVAASTKKEDATKIGIGAGAGAVIGGIIGGGSGAAKGAAIGGGAGAGAVLATRGDEVRLPAGTVLSVKLTTPFTVRIPVE
jgi:hypothetical protein